MTEATEEVSADIPAELLATEEASAPEPKEAVVTEAEAKLAALNESARQSQKARKPATLPAIMDELAAIRAMLESLTS